jgi:hypothetical protein
MPDIKDLLKKGGVNVERTATELFGNAVEDFSKGKLEPRLKEAFGRGNEAPPNNTAPAGEWWATSYAHSLANTNYRPKLKFLFKVEFLFKPQIISEYPELKDNKFIFLVKTVDRPKVEFEYEEVNQYNFRTKVLKQIRHRELTMTFADDTGNQVYNFFRIMMMVHSPITRRSASASHDIAEQVEAYNSGNGMIFSSDIGRKNDYATRAALNTDIGNAIQAIKITQFFVQPMAGADKIDGAAKEVAFFFMNPRIVSFDLDDVSHESSDPNLFTMQFDYDFMVMAPMRVMKADPPEKRFVGLPGSPGDPMPTGRGASAAGTISAKGGPAEGGGGENKFTRTLSAIGGRAAERIVGDTFGKYIRQVPGLGRAADTLGGLVGGSVRSGIGDLLGSVSAGFNGSGGVGGSGAGGTGGGSSGIGGGAGGTGGGLAGFGNFIGSAGRSLYTGASSRVSSVVNSASQALSRSSRSVVSDNTTPGADSASFGTSTGGFGLGGPGTGNGGP